MTSKQKKNEEWKKKKKDEYVKMKILGLDISSSSTGWSLIDNDKLSDYGLIKPDSSMSVFQRLYLFGNEMKRIIERCQPDMIAAEEAIFARGMSTMRTLSRFSGVAIFQAYSYQKKDVKTYVPPEWKKMIGLSGFATKPEIQLCICHHFKLLEEEKIKSYKESLDKIVEEIHELKYSAKHKVADLKKELSNVEYSFKLLKKGIKAKKKKEITEEDGNKLQNDETVLESKKSIFKERKKEVDKNLKEVVKKVDKMSSDIYSDCGISPDLADSIGVGLACLHETKQGL
jgi:Holliday junction resolvasome RuvABC endonuclease subunit